MTQNSSLNLVILGAKGHGKTTLTAAMMQVLSAKGDATVTSYDQINAAPIENVDGISIQAAHVAYKTQKRSYTLTDWPEHADCMKNMVIGSTKIEGAILVVSAETSPVRQTAEQLELARQIGIPHIVVYLNKVELVEEDMLEFIQEEIGISLNKNGYTCNASTIICGAASLALNNEASDNGVKSINKLLDALDNSIPDPISVTNPNFFMPVVDYFTLSGRGTVATGKIETGKVKIGDELELIGFGMKKKFVVNWTEIQNQPVQEASAGSDALIGLGEISKDEVEKGMVLAKPGTIEAHTEFTAILYVLTKEEGGRSTAFSNGYSPQWFFRAKLITGEITNLRKSSEDIEVTMLGAPITGTIKLRTAVPMTKGLHFKMMEGGRTIGLGVVTSIIK